MGSKKLHWWSSPRLLLRTILMLDDSRHSIALGTAIGMFIGLTPTVGIQMLLVIVFSFLTRRLMCFNRVAALITVYVSNPLTMVPLYYCLYRVGTLFVAGNLSRERLRQILNFDGVHGWWGCLRELMIEIGTPLLIGTAILATCSAVLTYPAMRFLLNRFYRENAPAAADA